MEPVTHPAAPGDIASPGRPDAPPSRQAEAPILEQLEADLAAVESAMASLERIATSDSPGAARAAEIAAVVSAQRFPLPGDPALEPSGSELVGDGLLDQ